MKIDWMPLLLCLAGLATIQTVIALRYGWENTSRPSISMAMLAGLILEQLFVHFT